MREKAWEEDLNELNPHSPGQEMIQRYLKVKSNGSILFGNRYQKEN